MSPDDRQGGASEDPLVRETEQAEEEAWSGEQERAANLFDLRRIIGGLFVLYGIVLIVVGLTDGQAEIRKAAGVHINLWAGIGMLILGLLFLVWAFSRPLGRQLQEAEAGSDEPGGRPGGDDDGARRNGGAGPEQS